MLGMLEAVRGCVREQTRMDVISNNLANAATPGFKGDRVSFRDLLERDLLPELMVSQEKRPPAGEKAALSGQVRGGRRGLQTVQVRTDMTQGTTRFTGNTLDLAIQGPGFFRVQTPDGVLLTRKGNFSLDREGYLVTQEGYQVLGSGGPIQVSGTDLKVDETGKVYADGSQSGQLDVFALPEEVRPVKVGNGLFRAPRDAEATGLTGQYTVKQGYLEDSNVNVSREMVNMIDSMRSFESYQKALRLLDGIDDRAINQVGRVR